MYSVEKISERSKKFGVWITGAKFFGKNVPELTWDDVQTEPQIKEDNDLLPKSPAELISAVVKAAIELRKDKASIKEWLDQVIEHLDQDIALRALVEKKLWHYRETALSFANLRSREGRYPWKRNRTQKKNGDI